MKLFPGLGLCFGSTGASGNQIAVETTTVTLPPLPELEPAEVPRSSSRRSNRRRLMKVHSAMLWKPELSAIAEEDRVVADGRRGEELTSRSEKKGSVNKADQTPAKRSSSPKYGNDYRKPCHRMVIPAFSPTPFVF